MKTSQRCIKMSMLMTRLIFEILLNSIVCFLHFFSSYIQVRVIIKVGVFLRFYGRYIISNFLNEIMIKNSHGSRNVQSTMFWFKKEQELFIRIHKDRKNLDLLFFHFLDWINSLDWVWHHFNHSLHGRFLKNFLKSFHCHAWVDLFHL